MGLNGIGGLRGFAGLFFVFVALVSCREDKGAQDPGLIFSDGVLPKMLDSIANQTHELRIISREQKERLTSDKSNPNLVEVAVIDSGTDVGHPDLASQMAYDTDENGDIIGAGYDVLGGDHFASGRLIDPTLFAFGASNVSEGFITNAPKNPLELIKDYNESFVSYLLSEVAKDPILSQSLFAKLSSSSINLYGADWWVDLENTDTGFEREKYQELLIEGRLYKVGLSPADASKVGMDPVEFNYALNEPWFTDAGSGLPSFKSTNNQVAEGSGINSVEHADRFFDLVKKVLKEFPQTRSYFQSKATLLQYLEDLDFSAGTGDVEKGRKVTNLLSRALQFKLYGEKVADPVYNVNRLIHEFGVELADFKRSVIESNGVVPKVLEEGAPLEIYYKIIDAILSHTNKTEMDLTPAETQKTEALREKLEGIKKLVRWVVEERSIGTPGLVNPDKPTPQASLNRRHLYYRNHPFANSGESEGSHGTHVARTIARQNKDVRIYPVRVLTGGVSLPKSVKEELKAKMLSEMKVWAAGPVVFRGLVDRAHELFPYLTESNDPAVRAAQVEKLFADMSSTFDVGFDSEYNMFEFINQINKAVRHISERGIRFANVSLGGKLESKTASLKDKNESGKKQKLYDLLSSEFQKFLIGKTIKYEGANTLFFVAMGNSNSWVDGLSRSAIPVDPSSVWLKPFERPELGETVPNNHIENIVGVGSLAPNGQLSTYTNVPLGQDPPVLFVRGEQVYASVARTDISGTREIFDYLALESLSLNPFSSAYDQRVLDFLEGFASLKTVADEGKRKKLELRLAGLFNSLNTIHHKLKDVLVLHLSQKIPDLGALFNGTSMASPHALGQAIGYYLEGETQKSGAEFAPRKVLEELLEKSQPVLGSRLRVNLPSIPDGDVGDAESEARPLAAVLKSVFSDEPSCVETLRGL
jgi:subtilisin family serine protease